MTPTTYGRDFAYCLKSHGGVRGFNASLWRFLLRCTLFCHSVATFLTSVSSYEGGCGFEVYKDAIEKSDKSFYAFDKFCVSEDSIVDPLCEYHKKGWPLIENSTLYYVRTDIIRGKRYYTLYNKYRMEHGKTFFQPWGWLRDHKSTPWGHGVSLKKGNESDNGCLIKK